MLEELPGDDGIEARVLERQRLLDVRLYGFDPQIARFRERRRVDVEADQLVSLEDVARQRSRAATEVEHALPTPDRGLEERDPLRNEDELAFGTAFPMVLFVALLQAHAELTAASCPSEAIVRRRPSSSGISGSQPRICLARVMSGCRTWGSSTGSAS